MINSGQLQESFCDLIDNNFLQQFVQGPTHIGGSHRPSKPNFNAYFSSIFQPSRSDQRETLIYYIYLSWINYQLWEIKLSEEEVTAWLSNLDTSNASGPDDIRARRLKQCSQYIAPRLCSLLKQVTF